jgi:polyhydroxyalkanoate synthesis regulator phasin
MARRPRQQVPDAVRDAVERTIQATVGSAQSTRDRAQDAVDEIVRGVGRAIDDRRPVTQEDVKALRKDLREIARRLDAIEQRLPAKRSPAKRTAAKPKPRPKKTS